MMTSSDEKELRRQMDEFVRTMLAAFYEVKHREPETMGELLAWLASNQIELSKKRGKQ